MPDDKPQPFRTTEIPKEELERQIAAQIQAPPQQFPVNLPEPIPFLISAQTHDQLAAFFDGPVPEIGDTVVMVCYGKVGNSRMFKWKVVDHGA